MASRHFKLLGVGLAAAIALGGCADYLDRRETVLLGAGNAVQTNIALQQIDPWPAGARNIRSDVSGERLQHAMERYRNPRAGSNAAPAESRPSDTSSQTKQ